MNIVVDTNIFMSALIKDSTTRNLMVNSSDNLLFPEFEFYEIEKHMAKLLEEEQRRIKKIFLQLKENPYVGDQIRYRHFREKRLREFII